MPLAIEVKRDHNFVNFFRMVSRSKRKVAGRKIDFRLTEEAVEPTQKRTEKIGITLAPRSQHKQTSSVKVFFFVTGQDKRSCHCQSS